MTRTRILRPKDLFPKRFLTPGEAGACWGALVTVPQHIVAGQYPNLYTVAMCLILGGIWLFSRLSSAQRFQQFYRRLERRPPLPFSMHSALHTNWP